MITSKKFTRSEYLARRIYWVEYDYKGLSTLRFVVRNNFKDSNDSTDYDSLSVSRNFLLLRVSRWLQRWYDFIVCWITRIMCRLRLSTIIRMCRVRLLDYEVVVCAKGLGYSSVSTKQPTTSKDCSTLLGGGQKAMPPVPHIYSMVIQNLVFLLYTRTS